MRQKVSMVLWVLVLWVCVVMLGFIQKQPSQEHHFETKSSAKGSFEGASSTLDLAYRDHKPPKSPHLSAKSIAASIDPQNGEAFHIFLCSDEADLRPMVAAVNSTVANTRHPDRLVFHLLVPKHIHKVNSRLQACYPISLQQVLNEASPSPRFRISQVVHSG